MSVISLARRVLGTALIGELHANAAGAAITGSGVGIVREVSVADVDLTLDPGDITVTLGPAVEVEILAAPGGGADTLTIVGPDDVQVTLTTLAVGWRSVGLVIKALRASGSTVTEVRVRW